MRESGSKQGTVAVQGPLSHTRSKNNAQRPPAISHNSLSGNLCIYSTSHHPNSVGSTVKWEYCQDPASDDESGEGGGGGHLVCVGVDGVQYPHLSFPPGDNMVTFLGDSFILSCVFKFLSSLYLLFPGCLETALYPNASLSPSVFGDNIVNGNKR